VGRFFDDVAHVVEIVVYNNDANGREEHAKNRQEKIPSIFFVFLRVFFTVLCVTIFWFWQGCLK
jgi:hypothetical protein